MQIGAINSINFGKSHRDYDEPIDVQYSVLEEDSRDPGMDQFIKDFNKANNDVSPISCIFGLVAGLTALRATSKGVGILRGLAATGAEKVSSGAVKFASKFKKTINVEDANKTINGFFEKFRGRSEVNDEKITSKVSGIIDSIFGKEVIKEGQVEKIKKSTGFINTLNKNGIFLNKKSLFDNGVAAVFAYGAADLASDVSEDAIDRKHINASAVKNLRMYKNMADTLINGLAQ